MGVKRDDAGLTRTYRLGVGVNVLLICSLAAVLAIGLVIVVRKLSYRYDLRFDVTADKRYELDPLAKQLLRDVESPLEIVFTWGYDTDILERVKDHQGHPRGDLLRNYYLPILQEAQVRIRRVLHEWERVSPNVKLTVLQQEADPVRTEEVARDLGLSTQEVLNKVILRLGGRRREVPMRHMMVDMQWGYFSSTPSRQTIRPRNPKSWAVQPELTRTLRAILAGEPIPIGVVSGLGGRIEPGTAEYTIFANILEGEGYEPVPFDLRPGTPVPERVKVVLVPAPKTPLTRDRSKILENYERQGGRLLLVASPRLPERYDRLLEKYGVSFVDALVRDRENTNPIRGTTELESTKLCTGSHPIIVPLKNRVTLYLGLARPLKISPRPPGAIRQKLLEGSRYAQDVAVAFDPASGGMKVVQGRITNHPNACFATAMTRDLQNGQQARVVAIGSASVFRPDVMMQGSLYGNRDLVLNMLADLTGRSSAIGRTPQTGLRERFVNPTRLTGPFTVIGVIVLPLLASMMGLIVYFLRRS
ncbi:MAG: hypothetical protein CMJ83_08105 [Planctomycetes bacterium]|nr:hypothetical protein [Planctomycetota bacterium]